MAKMEIWMGRERRRRWSDEQKLQILEEVAASGVSVSEIARRHDVVPQQIYTWRRQLLDKARAEAREQEGSPVFLPVSVVAEPEEPRGDRPPSHGKKPKTAAARASHIEIRLAKGGRILKVAADLDPAVLQALIRAVEEA
jgi:transposase